MSTDNSFNEFMKSHMRVMREMWRMQNAQIQALQQLIRKSQAQGFEALEPNYTKVQNPKSSRRLQDSEAVVDDLKKFH